MEFQYEVAGGAAPAQSFGATGGSSGAIMTLTAADFTVKSSSIGELLALTNRQEPLFVLFHSNTCGVCTRVVPMYREIAKQVGHQLATCDVGEHGSVAMMSRRTIKPIAVVPMLFCYKNGVPYTLYSDRWDPTKIINYMHNSIGKVSLPGANPVRPAASDEPTPYNLVICSKTHGCYVTTE